MCLSDSGTASFGREIAGNLLSCQKIKEKGVTPFWVLFSAAYGCGVLLLTWAVYIAAWLLSVYGGSNTPLFGANLIVMTAAAVFSGLPWLQKEGSFKGL